MIVRKFVKGSTLVSLYGQLKDAEGNALDISGQTITFYMEDSTTGRNKIDGRAATIVTASLGKVRYDWAAEDVDTAGEFFGWFRRTSGGAYAYHPIGRELKIVIEERP